jgi:hypothetical protein
MVDCNLSSIKSIILLLSYFYPSFLGFLSFHRLDLVSTASIPWVAMVLAYLSSRRRLAGGEAPLSSVSGAPDFHQNRQNRTVRFAKPDSPSFATSRRSFRFLFILCGQHILATPLETRSSPAMAHYGMEIYNSIMPSIYTNTEVRYLNYLPVSNSFDPSCGN